MSGHTSTNDQSMFAWAEDVGGTLAAVAKEFGIAVFAAVWTVVWVALAYQTAQSEGLLDGIIVVVYTLAPVVGLFLWRLGALTSFSPPTLDDLVGPDDSSGDPEETDEDEVADRYTFGEG